jgi:hypothetical protein
MYVVVSSADLAPWRVSFIYGESHREKRHEFWSLLRRLYSQRKGPWLVCGDFNEVLSQEEQAGVNPRTATQMELFRSCLEDCGLMDLGFSGPSFTWSNKQEGDALVRVRLDRAVANEEFTSRFEDVSVENIITTTSDHFAVIIRLQPHSGTSSRRPVQSGFKFEAAWLRAPDYREMVENAWTSLSDGPRSLQSTWNNLQSITSTLKTWSIESFGCVRKEIKKVRRKTKGY